MSDKEIYKQISRYINEELSDSEIDRLWEEFLKNPEAFEFFETELNLADLFRNKGYGSDISKSNIVGEPTYIRYKNWIYSAAAAIILSLGLQIFSMQEGDVIKGYALSEINVSEMMGSDIYRADPEDVNTLDVAINQALAKAFTDEAEEALRMFTELTSRDLSEGQKALVHLNMGILYYNQGDDEKSIEQFTTVLNLEDIPRFTEEKAWWFMGNAFLNVQKMERAREAVFNTYTLNGKFEVPALALLKKIDREHLNQPARVQ
ncbi:MAG: hypothetical protein WEA58_08630 [Balneolaceae bacterium]